MASLQIIFTWAFWQSSGHMRQMLRTIIINKMTIKFFPRFFQIFFNFFSKIFSNFFPNFFLDFFLDFPPDLINKCLIAIALELQECRCFGLVQLFSNFSIFFQTFAFFGSFLLYKSSRFYDNDIQHKVIFLGHTAILYGYELFQTFTFLLNLEIGGVFSWPDNYKTY